MRKRVIADAGGDNGATINGIPGIRHAPVDAKVAEDREPNSLRRLVVGPVVDQGIHNGLGRTVTRSHIHQPIIYRVEWLADKEPDRTLVTRWHLERWQNPVEADVAVRGGWQAIANKLCSCLKETGRLRAREHRLRAQIAAVERQQAATDSGYLKRIGWIRVS